MIYNPDTDEWPVGRLMIRRWSNTWAGREDRAVALRVTKQKHVCVLTSEDEVSDSAALPFPATLDDTCWHELVPAHKTAGFLMLLRHGATYKAALLLGLEPMR